jgi:hypothetical protein
VKLEVFLCHNHILRNIICFDTKESKKNLISIMKYSLVFIAIAASFNGFVAAEPRALQEEEVPAEEPAEEPAGDGSVFGQAVREFLADTLNTVQSVTVPTIGSGQFLTSVNCDETTISANTCNLIGGVTGVNMCRPLGGLDVSICAPKIFDVFIGTSKDTCGCCPGETCAVQPNCLCGCQDGKGVLVTHEFFTIFNRKFSWDACYTPTIANSIINARQEFYCNAECPEAIAAQEAAEAAAAAVVAATAGGE